jgi:hypothetical protein
VPFFVLALLSTLLLISGTSLPVEAEVLRQTTGYPQVQPYPSNDRFYCMKRNPSCGRDPWWMEFWDLEDDHPVEFAAVGPGFVSEARYAEAVNLIWQWPEGRFLLNEAARHGVKLRTASSLQFPTAAATYGPSLRLILINPRFVKTSTWMLAGLTVHELKHAADHRAGSFQGLGKEDCHGRERHAYQAQQRYLVWLTHDLVRQPIPMHLVNQHLSPADRELAHTLVRIGRATSVDQLVAEDFARICAH